MQFDSSPFDNTLTPPPGYVTPSFPSLYDPRLEFKDSDSNDPTPGTHYLYYSFGELWSLLLLHSNLPTTHSNLTYTHANCTNNSFVSQLDIYRFTLYWTLLFYASSFALCGTCALLVRVLSKRRAPKLFVTVVLAFILIGTFFAVVGSAIVGEFSVMGW